MGDNVMQRRIDIVPVCVFIDRLRKTFALDEIRPRDWLNVTRSLSLRRKNKILWPTRWMAFDNTKPLPINTV